MPNHYTNIITTHPDHRSHDDLDLREVLKSLTDGKNLIADIVDPMPDKDRQDWYEWQYARWGVKWGCYDLIVHPYLHGDSDPVLITFITPWCAPNRDTRDRVVAWLQSNGAASVRWDGFNPLNDGFESFGVWPRKAALAKAAPEGGSRE